MPKRFITFLVIAQSLLVFVHLLIFSLLLLFFPVLAAHKISLLIVLLLLSFSFLVSMIFTHDHQNFFLDWGSIFAGVWVVLAFYFLFASLVVLLLYIVNVINLTTAGWIAVAISSLFSLYGIVNARITRLAKITAKLKNLPEAWKGKTAIMVSDLHLGQILHKRFARKIVKLINAENPEIVFIPGDFYDGVHTDFAGLANEFKNVKAPQGIYFCSGNHEMFAGYEKCEAALRGAGIKILENQKVELNGLQIAGVAYKQETMPDLPQTLVKLELAPGKPTVLLKHVPLQLEDCEKFGASLTLCGHSHQGQIWPGRHITKRYFSGYDYGFKTLGKMLVYISSGVGTWGPPLRVFTAAEMVKITFE